MYTKPFNEIDKSEFLANYWQKKPCFFKGAFTCPPDYLTGDELAGLSMEEEIESRLISHDEANAQWKVKHGPFEPSAFQNLSESHWTLLIQSIDSWEPKTRQLLHHFRFIPRWRFDDLMVSFACDQGGVGPHADDYDVFLIQGSGTRRWRVGEENDTSPLQQIGDIAHVNKFEPIIDVLMEPGDMLYVPPKTAHWGLSIGESIGYSVGYRSLQTHQLLTILTEDLIENKKYSRFFQDHYRKKPNASNQLEDELVKWAQDELIRLSKQPNKIADLLAKQLSLSKLGLDCQDYIDPSIDLTDDTKIQLLQDVSVNWIINGDTFYLYIEGECFEFDAIHKNALQILASYGVIPLKMFKIPTKTVDFPSTLSNIVSRGYSHFI